MVGNVNTGNWGEEKGYVGTLQVFSKAKTAKKTQPVNFLRILP